LRIGERTQDGNAPGLPCDGKHIGAIAEKHDRTARRIERDVAVFEAPRLVIEIRGRIAIGIIEEAHLFLEHEHTLGRPVDMFDAHRTALQRLGQSQHIGMSHHVDIDTGLERQCRGFGEIGGDTMRDELGNGTVVTDDDALEAPLPTHDIAQDCDIGGKRNAVHVGEGRHDGGGACHNRGLERRQIDLMQRALRYFDLGIVATGESSTIGGQVLRRGGERQR
jgi:hypothetical protein